MTEPFRLRLQKAVCDLLEGITPANGYVTDLSGAVFRGRNRFGSDDPLPMLSVLEPMDGREPWGSPAPSPSSHGQYPLIVQGFVKDDPDNPTDPAHILMADVKRALALEKAKTNRYDLFGLGNGENSVIGITIGGGVVRPADEYSSKAYFWLVVTLNIVENLADPYA